tara:strand:- start:486 stop:824 length:339 start_codon:yes stop_codon:yes gene_type:complete
MGLSKAYGKREAERFISASKYKPGQIVQVRSGWAKGRTGEVEEVILSMVTRGALLYRVRLGRGPFDSMALQEKDLSSVPLASQPDGCTKSKDSAQPKSGESSDSQLDMFDCG